MLMKGRIALATLVAAGLAFATVGIAAAQSGGGDSRSARHGYVGTVTESSTTTLVVQVKPEEGATSSPATIAFVITGGTRIKTPGAASKTSVGGALEAGAKVAVLGEKREDGSWQAVQVLVKPRSPVTPPVTGAVASIENGVLTLVLPNGKTKTIEVGSDGASLEQGEVVTIFAQDESEGSRPAKAKGLVRASEVHERLAKSLNDVEANRPDLPPAVKQHREEIASKLAGLLEQHANHKVEVLQGLLSREGLPAKARAGIERALQNAQDKQGEARSKADGVRERLGLPKPGQDGKSARPSPQTGKPEGTPGSGRSGQGGGR